MSRFLIASLYQFTPLPDFRAVKELLHKQCREHDVKGTLLVAEEGINGTLAAPEDQLRAFLTQLRCDSRFAEMEHKESWSEEAPFLRLKVRLKKEIISLGVADSDPTKAVGTYVAPTDWNALIQQPDVVLIDVRNTYETAVGSFDGAIDPGIESFSEFPQWLAGRTDISPETPVAMFCTGGIRCEKASSYMLQQGFENVYHLQGGILKYLETVATDASQWNGECYVFDRRVSVDHQLDPGSYDMCRACGHPLTTDDKASANFIEGVACAHCYETSSDTQKAGFAERQRQIELARERNESHFAVQPGSDANIE